MTELSLQQQRALLVLDRIANEIRSDDERATEWSNDLNAFLDELLGMDAFGTEGQTDPRGDGRDGRWTMFRVQGVDE